MKGAQERIINDRKEVDGLVNIVPKEVGKNCNIPNAYIRVHR